MQPSRGCIVIKPKVLPIARRSGRGRARGLAPRGRPGAHPRRRGEARPRWRYPAEAGWPASGGCGARLRPDARRGGKRARPRNARTRQRQPRGISPPTPTHRCGGGRSAKRTRPKPICRLASAADASETAPAAWSERLGRNHAHVREERKSHRPHAAILLPARWN